MDETGINRIAEELREMFHSDPSGAQENIEDSLMEKLSDCSSSEKMAHLAELIHRFSADTAKTSELENLEEDKLLNLFSFLRGKSVSPADLSSRELLQRLAEALNTIFTELNQIVGEINMIFLGKDSMEQTIRHVIGIHLQGESATGSLETYLGQIRQSFKIAHESFQKSSYAVVHKILEGLDPSEIQASGGGGLFAKGKLFGVYEDKYKECRKWFDGGRFNDELLREFERNCQKLSMK